MTIIPGTCQYSNAHYTWLCPKHRCIIRLCYAPEHRLDGGEEPRRVLDEAGEDEHEARMVELRRDAEGLRIAPQSRLGLSNGDIQHRAKTDTCVTRSDGCFGGEIVHTLLFRNCRYP